VEAYEELERGVRAALETYSNVHRGTGHHSIVSTHLFEQARDIVLEHLRLSKSEYVVVFCTPRRAMALASQLKAGTYQGVSSEEIGLALGIRALAIHRGALPGGAPFQSGGGTVRLVSPGGVIWADAPDKFEAGTPAIINVIAFATSLRLVRRLGMDAFREAIAEKRTAAEILYHDELEGYSGRELLEELRQTLIGSGILVPTSEGLRPYINLDNAASTPTFAPVWNSVFRTWRQPRQVQRQIIHEVESICAGALGAPREAYDVIFTSNTTEAINLVAESLSRECDAGDEPVVLNTLLEHTSNELPWRRLLRSSQIRIPVDAEGFVNLNELEKLLCDFNRESRHGRKRIRLVAVSGASNVLGVFNDLVEISGIVHRYGAQLLVDAAQLIAHRRIDMDRCGMDHLAFSAHKAYAPFGTGVLVARKGLLKFSPKELELIRSSGEENAGGIAGLGKALLLLTRIGLDRIQEKERALTARALRGLAQIPGLEIYGIKDPDSSSFARKGGVIAFGLKNVPHNLVARELAERGGIGVRSGCHCAHLLVKSLLDIDPWRVWLTDLGLILFPRFTGAVLPGLVRVSLGIENGEEDVDTLLRVLGRIARQRRSRTDKLIASMHYGTRILPQTDVQHRMDDFARTAARRVYAHC
jgi:selenocysteine lyase/cysteine desulfurase